MENISRAQLEFILDVSKTPYKKRCIWQGYYFGQIIKLYSIEAEHFAYIECIEADEIRGYFFTDITQQNVYDLRNWRVAKDVVVDFLSDVHD